MFEMEYEVRVSDINYGGHMGNEVALIIFQQARIELFKSIGFSEMNVGDGVATIQKNAQVEYLGECHLGDRLKVRIVNIDLKRSNINIFYEVYSDEKTVLTGSTLIVAYRYSERKIGRFSEEFLRKIEEKVKGI